MERSRTISRAESAETVTIGVCSVMAHIPGVRSVMGSVRVSEDLMTGSVCICSVNSPYVSEAGRKARYAKMTSQAIRRVNRLITRINCDTVSVFGISTRASSFRPFLTENSTLLLPIDEIITRVFVAFWLPVILTKMTIRKARKFQNIEIALCLSVY